MIAVSSARVFPSLQARTGFNPIQGQETREVTENFMARQVSDYFRAAG
jgi:hypothetical protein